MVVTWWIVAFWRSVPPLVADVVFYFLTLKLPDPAAGMDGSLTVTIA